MLKGCLERRHPADCRQSTPCQRGKDRLLCGFGGLGGTVESTGQYGRQAQGCQPFLGLLGRGPHLAQEAAECSFVKWDYYITYLVGLWGQWKHT